MNVQQTVPAENVAKKKPVSPYEAPEQQRRVFDRLERQHTRSKAGVFGTVRCSRCDEMWPCTTKQALYYTNNYLKIVQGTLHLIDRLLAISAAYQKTEYVEIFTKWRHRIRAVYMKEYS